MTNRVFLARPLGALLLSLCLAAACRGPAGTEGLEQQLMAVDQGLREDPGDVELLRQRAELVELAGFPRAARRDLERALAKAPGDAPLHLALGRILVQLDLPRAALDTLARARALGCDRSAAADLEGACARAYRLAGQLPEALDAYRRAIAVSDQPDPDFLVEAASLAALDDAAASQAGRQQALAWLDHAWAVDPAHPRIDFVRGLLLESSPDPEACIAAYARAVQLDPFFAPAWRNLAAAARRSKRPDLAYRATLCAWICEPDPQDRRRLRENLLLARRTGSH